MADDPIAGIEGGVVGLGVATSLLGKVPVVGPELSKLATHAFKGAPTGAAPRDFNDGTYGRTVGTDQGNPIREGSIDAASTDVTGAAAAGGEAGAAGLGDMAALAAL